MKVVRPKTCLWYIGSLQDIFTICLTLCICMNSSSVFGMLFGDVDCDVLFSGVDCDVLMTPVDVDRTSQ